MKHEIIHTAIENLKTIAKIDAQWIEKEKYGRLRLIIDNEEIILDIELKKELRQYHILNIKKNKFSPNNTIIIAEHIFPKIKDQLRELEIPYIEANGNMFLKTDKYYILIDTNKKIKRKKESANRAFTKTGLKVVFAFLQYPGLINEKQREIARMTSVGLGNIPLIIKGLKETGYILPLNKNRYIWENREELLDRWIHEYAIQLRPNLKLGRYSLMGNWKEIKLNHAKTLWGGEPAADLLTNHLRPEKFILYTKENRLELMKNYRLIPKDTGEVEVLELFWNNDKYNVMTAPPILIYAELILNGGKRNTETAGLIYDEYIKPIL